MEGGDAQGLPKHARRFFPVAACHGPARGRSGRWRGHVEKSYVSRHLTRLLPDGWGPHSLRHRYATRMYETTHDLLLVSKLLGHSSVETTQIYVAMPDSRLRVGLDAVTLAG